MLRRILGLLGWLGVALVFAAVAIRFLKPEWQPWYSGLALAGLVCTLLYMLSQWREVARSFSGREARFGTVAIVSSSGCTPSSSSHRSGVDTCPPTRARTDQAPNTVLCGAF